MEEGVTEKSTCRHCKLEIELGDPGINKYYDTRWSLTREAMSSAKTKMDVLFYECIDGRPHEPSESEIIQSILDYYSNSNEDTIESH